MISVLVPSRHRPELAKRLLDTINNTKKNDVEVKLSIDTCQTRLLHVSW